ncbi:hypothetical protein SOMG_05119 [Schizosaccharomyces osmophilus]|uniref:Uncharacterized protein n=1 Tax=Schizosaccharomyces osmophilus TaxID=2545709 RepID=A0AAE9WAY5_9SCHI|nr:uncharacterized protein SOMG_05119 [Schizosaccharomyces osmophilus]WBW72309.1 hypothetical protein SOMG_05119 [Schizosaccharomyces osmophilus]
MFLGSYRNFLRKNVKEVAKSRKNYNCYYSLRPQCFSTAAFLRNKDTKNSEVIFGGQSLDDLFNNVKKSMKEKKDRSMASTNRKTSGNARNDGLEKLDSRPNRQRRNSLQGNRVQLPGFQDRRSQNRSDSAGKTGLQSGEYSARKDVNNSEFPPKFEGIRPHFKPLNRPTPATKEKLKPSEPSVEEVTKFDLADSSNPKSIRAGSRDRLLHKYDAPTTTSSDASVKNPRAKSRKRLQKQEETGMSVLSEGEAASSQGSNQRKKFFRTNVAHLSSFHPQLILPQQLVEFVSPSTSLPKGLQLMKKQLQASVSYPRN